MKATEWSRRSSDPGVAAQRIAILQSDILLHWTKKRSAYLSEQVPRELAENLQAFKTSTAIDEYSAYLLFPEEKQLVAKHYKPGDRILDLACGMGRTTLRLHELGFVVRGVDASEIFIKTAQRRFPYLDLRVGSYDRIDEPDDAFSHVLISCNGIDYAFPESQRLTALRECARVLKPGGTLIYSSHNLKVAALFFATLSGPAALETSP